MVEYNLLKPKDGNYNDIYNFLCFMDEYYNPKLSVRVDISEYAKKIVDNAYLYTAIYEGKIVGLNAFYFNQYPKYSFATTLSVLPDYQGLFFIGMNLVKKSISFCMKHSSAGYWLAVRASNLSIVGFYKRLGFYVKSEGYFPNTEEKEFYMQLDFKKENHE